MKSGIHPYNSTISKTMIYTNGSTYSSHFPAINPSLRWEQLFPTGKGFDNLRRGVEFQRTAKHATNGIFSSIQNLLCLDSSSKTKAKSGTPIWTLVSEEQNTWQGKNVQIWFQREPRVAYGYQRQDFSRVPFWPVSEKQHKRNQRGIGLDRLSPKHPSPIANIFTTSIESKTPGQVSIMISTMDLLDEIHSRFFSLCPQFLRYSSTSSSGRQLEETGGGSRSIAPTYSICAVPAIWPATPSLFSSPPAFGRRLRNPKGGGSFIKTTGLSARTHTPSKGVYNDNLHSNRWRNESVPQRVMKISLRNYGLKGNPAVVSGTLSKVWYSILDFDSFSNPLFVPTESLRVRSRHSSKTQLLDGTERSKPEVASTGEKSWGALSKFRKRYSVS